MNRALRRWQQHVVKVRHRRILCEYWGWDYWVEPTWRDTWSHHWRPIGSQIMTESGHSRWVNQMMTRPARAKQTRALQAVRVGRDPDQLYWPDFKRPFIYYW